MARNRKEDVKSKGERQQVILRLVQEHPISRQEVLLDHLSKEGFEVTQATVSRFPQVSVPLSTMSLYMEFPMKRQFSRMEI